MKKVIQKIDKFWEWYANGLFIIVEAVIKFFDSLLGRIKLKDDWKRTRKEFIFWAIGTFFILFVTLDSIHMAIEYSNSVYYIVATWQLFYGVMAAASFFYQKNADEWRKIVFRYKDLCDDISRGRLNDLAYLEGFTGLKRGVEYVLISQTAKDGSKYQGIHCLNCGKTSYNENDIKNLWCENCKKNHKKNE